MYICVGISGNPLFSELCKSGNMKTYVGKGKNAVKQNSFFFCNNVFHLLK